MNIEPEKINTMNNELKKIVDKEKKDHNQPIIVKKNNIL